ncbi:hypothetical protein ACFSJY_19200 [Thalassotalea euphylliae]|uniref:hypothetical protein n=1 Tax=Thalassotalea euphylliae TaxID=1655234 RepID=UPI00362A0F11
MSKTEKFENILRRYNDKYFVTNTDGDGIARIKNRKNTVSIDPYNFETGRLDMINHQSSRSFTYKTDKLIRMGVQLLEVENTDDGGFLVFKLEDLDKIDQVFNLRKRRQLSAEQRKVMSERAKQYGFKRAA